MFPTDNDFETSVTLETEMSSQTDDLPFKILFMGDWSGNRNSVNVADSKLRPIEIDRDNFENVIKKFRVGLELFFDDSETNLSLEFSELEDFHPDKIFQQVPLFSNLREIRRKLSNANTYNEAASEVRSWLKSKGNSELLAVDIQETSTSDKQLLTDNLLEQILGQTASEVSAPSKPNGVSTELGAFIGKLVKPHLIQTDLEEQSNLLMVVDEVTSDLMRKIIHHPQFQALESAWRGLFLLVRKLETDNNLKIYLLDIGKSQLSENLKSTDDLTNSQIYRLISDSDNSWAVMCGNYTFGLNVDDIGILIRLAKIGFNTNVPFVSHVQPEMFGFKSFDPNASFDKLQVSSETPEVKLWNVLRSLPESSHLGLALPRFLVRLPYGEKTEPTEAFYFEELTSDIQHENYLWGNPAFICALLLGQSFNNSGWKLSGNLVQNLEGLPLYFYQKETETKSQSCAEIIMTQTNAEILIEHGLMPLISFRNADNIRVGKFQSINFSGSMLSGKWN